MTIQEAIKSGKSFKRKNFYMWMRCEKRNDFESIRDGAGAYYPDVADILADDWEIEEEKIEITKSQILKAFRKLEIEFATYPVSRRSRALSPDYIIRELGFKS